MKLTFKNRLRCLKCKMLLDSKNQFHWCTSPGKHIYYNHANGDTYPGIILAVKIEKNGISRKIKIKYNGLYRDVISWVKRSKIELQ